MIMVVTTHTFLFLTLTVAAPEHGGCFVAGPPSSPSTPVATAPLFAVKEDVLKNGRLVEFTSGSGANKQVGLGSIIGKEGKRLKILTSSGGTQSVPPRDVKHVVPNGLAISTEAEIARHESAAATALAEDVAEGGRDVAELWEMLSEEGGDADLVTLAELLSGDASSVSCHATRAVLTLGAANFYFKEITPKSLDGTGPTYEPRQADVVEVSSRSSEARVWVSISDVV